MTNTVFNSLFNETSSKIFQLIQRKIQNTNDEKILVWIFFTDKGNDLQKYFSLPNSIISEKSLQRRAKVKTQNNLIDENDFPVFKNYIDKINQYDFTLKQKSKWFNGISGFISTNNLEKIANLNFVKKIDIVYQLKKIKNVDENSINKNFNFPQKTIHSFDYGNSYTQLNQINVPLAHDLGYHGENITICLMDAGFNNLEHEVFSNMNIIAKYDFVNHDDDVDDSTDMGEGSHGTQTLSAIGGFKEGELIGPSFASNFILAKTENTDSETPIEEDNWIAAMEWADSIGVDVTSTSLGYIGFDTPYPDYTWQSMDGNTCRITIGADMAVERGIVVLNSAGNEGDDPEHNTLGAPSDGDSVIAVGAVNSNGSRASFSSVGPTVDGRIKPNVMAMGSSVIVASPWSGTSYTSSSGTSFSCPLTAGVVGVLLSAIPNLTPIQVRDALQNTANNSTSPNNHYGWGIVNTVEAINYFKVNITHTKLTDTENPNRIHKIIAELTSQFPIDVENSFLFYSINNSPFDSIQIQNITGNFYEAAIPTNQNNITVRYYLRVKNSAAIISYFPQNDYFQFYVGSDNVIPQIQHQAINVQSIFTFPPKIKATVIDNIGVQNVKVKFQYNGIQQNDFNLIHTINNRYEANLPFDISQINIGDIFSYQIIAIDSSSQNNVAYFPTDSTYQSFTIVETINYVSDFNLSNGELLPTEDWEWGSTISPNPYSEPNFWGTKLIGEYTNGPLLSTLETPSLRVISESPTITFYHWYNIENRYDGGNVKIKINNGPPILITPIGNYDTTLSTQYENPLGGERAFSGNSNGWQQEIFDLSGITNLNDNIVISFQFGVDNIVTSRGWFLDNLSCDGLGWIPLSVKENNLPTKFSLKQNFPNPFNPKTKIKYEIVKSGFVNLKVFDILGREIKTLVNENKNVGTYEIDFDANNLNSGIYFYKLTTNNFSEMKKMILVK